MSSFSRFQELNRAMKEAEGRRNTTFVFTAENSVDLTLFDSSSETPTITRASVVNKQEKDQAYIYTELTEPLNIGSIWGAKGLNWLISEEIIIMKDVNWHKYLAFLCNADIGDYKGYFIGPEATFVKVKLELNANLTSLQHSVLILPSAATLAIDDTLVIGSRAWRIQEADEISTPGLTYYSLRATTIAKQTTIESANDITPEFKETPVLEDEVVKIAPNTPITITTEDGYFTSSNPKIHITTHTATKVVFDLPFGVPSATISYKRYGEVITQVIEQVM